MLGSWLLLLLFLVFIVFAVPVDGADSNIEPASPFSPPLLSLRLISVLHRRGRTPRRRERAGTRSRTTTSLPFAGKKARARRTRPWDLMTTMMTRTRTRRMVRAGGSGAGTDPSSPRIWRRWRTGRVLGTTAPSRRCGTSECSHVPSPLSVGKDGEGHAVNRTSSVPAVCAGEISIIAAGEASSKQRYSGLLLMRLTESWSRHTCQPYGIGGTRCV